jgi:aerobic carbon-monoxide dehydrogenase medium subunit
VIPAAVEYRRAATIEDALDALADPEAKALAGGQSLIPVLKLRLARPSVLVDIGGLPLRDVTVGEDTVRIGSLTTWDELLREPMLARPGLAAIQECATGIGDLQVRNRGTVGGSLVHADPASDFPAVALALGASIVLQSRSGERIVDAEAFFLGPFMTTIGAQELMTEIVVPLPARGSGSAYSCVEHPASGFALAGAAALVRPDGTRSVAVTGIGSHAFALAGGDPAALEAADVFGDDFAPAEYRRHLAGVVVQRALDAAAKRAAEDA